MLFTSYVVTGAKYKAMKSDSPGCQELMINGAARSVPPGSAQVPQTVPSQMPQIPHSVNAQMPQTGAVQVHQSVTGQMPQTVTAQMPQTVNVIHVSSNNHLPPTAAQPITENGCVKTKMENTEM